jgi:hypothetical protein
VKTLETDATGSSSSFLLPQTLQCTKGEDRVTIAYNGGSLEAVCDWDLATLDIKRLQPHSDMYNALINATDCTQQLFVFDKTLRK